MARCTVFYIVLTVICALVPSHAAKVKLVLVAKALIILTPDARVRFFSKSCWNLKNFSGTGLKIT